MRLSTAATIFGVIILGVFAALAFSLIKTSNMLDREAQELARASENIRIAKELKSNLLQHNRHAFLYSLDRNNAHLERRRLLRNLIMERLKAMNRLVDTAEEGTVLVDATTAVSAYLNIRERPEDIPSSPIGPHDLDPVHVDRATLAIDTLIAVNHDQMQMLTESIKLQNREANRIGIVLFSLGGLVLLCIVLGLFLFIARPLTALAKVISSYSAGYSGARAQHKGLKEIIQIGANFNSMAERLEGQRQDQVRFIASIAHDLRNPLNSISMASEILMSNGQAEDRELSRIIFRQVKNLDRLTSDLLDTIRIEAGQFSLNPVSQDVGALIRDAVELYRTGSDLHGFKIDLTSESLLCTCDSGRLSQVFHNLISNAVKYSPNGGTISVVTRREPDRIVISISDQGIGIDPQDLENIFKPFHRSKATRDTIPGIGLGLSSSRRIIEAHGGRLSVESVLGKGTTFHIVLPAPADLHEIARREEPPTASP